MDGITDEPFRLTQCHIAKPDLVFTEFVSAEGLSRGGIKLFDHLLYSSEEQPIIAQLFGKDPDSFYKSAVILCHLGFAGIDINFGCPAKTVVQHGSGASLIAKPDLAAELVRSVQSAVADFSSGKVKINQLGLNQKTQKIIARNLQYSNHRSPITDYRLPTISIKTRLGLNTDTSSDWIPSLLKLNPDFISLHGRTLKQGYSGLADWQAIGRAAVLCHAASVKILGNGDIKTRRQGIDYCQKYDTDGVLIGRASLGNPWAFSERSPSALDRFHAAVYHYRQSLRVFPDRSLDPLRRHLLAYASGLPHAKALRARLVRVSSLAGLQSLKSEFCNQQLL